MSSSPPPTPADGPRALLIAFGAALAVVSLAYTTPELAQYRPWSPGDPIPVLAALIPRSEARVVEGDAGELIVASVLEAPVEPATAAVELASGVTTTLPAHPPGVPTPLLDADHRGMDHFYRALAATKTGKTLARVAHYGDSTIAADGISGTVRSRLQARFGNGGPGYLSAGMDPRWNTRPDVAVGRHGEWNTASLLLGGGGGRYGYGGIVATAAPESYVTFTPAANASGVRPVLSHLEVWSQRGAGFGSWWGSADGKGVFTGSGAAEGTSDDYRVADIAGGYSKVAIGATGGAVPFYGVVMETAGPGVVWDALGVVGVGTKSFTQFNKKHLAAQVAARKPDLVVVMLGGNELGYPVLSQGDGSGYAPYFTGALRMIRAGAPDSSCLIVTPLDQGTREGAKPGTKPGLLTAVRTQRALAAAEGCAFWDAFAAMGGQGAIVRWSGTRPPLAWTDLLHLSAAGQDIIGQMLADAIESGFDAWSSGGGVGRAVPTPPGPPVVPAPPAAAPMPAPAVPAK